MPKALPVTPIETRQNWSTGATILIAVCALVVSVYTTYSTNHDSYLSHRAYIAPAAWEVLTKPDETASFQFPISNYGETPGEELEAKAWIELAGVKGPTTDLLPNEKLSIFPGIAHEFLPKLTWESAIPISKLPDFAPDHGNRLVLMLRYKDFEGKERGTLSKFVVIKLGDKLLLSLVHQQST